MLHRSFSIIKRSFASNNTHEVLKRTPLFNFHVQLGAKMVPFCGWDMPVQYKEGVLKSHIHTRENASIFDVSHMGQVKITGKDRIKFIESVSVADVEALQMNQARLSSFTTQTFGVIDDCMITKRPDHIYMVINAGCHDKDMEFLNEQLKIAKNNGMDVDLKEDLDSGLIALQGPKAMEVLAKHVPINLTDLPFMYQVNTKVNNIPILVTRCGYTGEDGFEISIPSSHTEDITKLLLNDSATLMAGLGARDSLRLEAGLCLYGHDLNETISPIEAGLLWTITKRRREQGGFPGFETFKKQLKEGVARKRVGILSDIPARENVEIFNADGKLVGKIDSGTMSPILKKGVAMGYVSTASSNIDTPLKLSVRGKMVDAKVVKLPFVPSHYYKKL